MTKRIPALILLGTVCVVLAGCPENRDRPIEPGLSADPRTDIGRADEQPRLEPGQPQDPAQADPVRPEQSQDRLLEESIRRPTR